MAFVPGQQIVQQQQRWRQNRRQEGSDSENSNGCINGHLKMKFLQHQLCSSDDSNQERSEKDSDSSMLMQREASNQDEASSNINRSLIRQLVVNQALIGYTIWTKGLGYNVLSSSATIPPYPLINFLLPIVLGAVPLLLLSALIESSESPLVSTLNL